MPQLLVFRSIPFLQEMGSGCGGVKSAALLRSALESGEEWRLRYKEERSELVI